MKTWLKTSILSIALVSLLAVGLFHALDLRLSRPSADIAFSPARPILEAEGRTYDAKPRNIILFIADGMGFGHLSLALHTQQADDTAAVWQEFEVKGWHDTKSTDGPLTDSGASATAMATGTATYWAVIGQDEDGGHLTNAFEIASAQGFTTGIVTDSYIWDATPAAFVAHTRSRSNSREILTQIAASELDLLFGELEDLGEDDNPDYAETVEILSRRFLLLDRPLPAPQTLPIDRPIAALYDEDEVQDLSSDPNLPQLTELALEYLSADDRPFILLVESEETDTASHRNDSERVVRGLQAIQTTLALILEFADTHPETLVVFTADHETGGLAAVADYDSYPDLQIRWSTKDHTAMLVPILATGPGAEHFGSIERNWQIGEILKGLLAGERRPDRGVPP